MIAVSILIVGLSAIGLGFSLISLLMGRAALSDVHSVTLGDAGVVGLWVMALTGVLLHLVVPLGGWPMALLPVTGFAGLAWQRAHVRAAALALWQDRQAVFLGTLALAAVVLTMRLKGASFYDTGLYHLQQILMQADGTIVLGAANIHMRFGYNSLLYVISGMAHLPGLGLSAALTINPVLFVFTITAIAQHRRDVQFPLMGTVGGWLLFALFFLGLWRGWVSSPLSDVAATLLVAHATLLTLRLFLSPVAEQDKVTLFALIALISALAVTVKLSALPVIGFVILAGWASRAALSKTPRPAIASLMACSVLGVFWMGRGILLSGCVAYPASFSCLQLPWTVPVAVAQADVASMRHYARVPGGTATLSSDGWGWIAGWLAEAMPWILALSLFMVILALIVPVLRRCGSVTSRAVDWTPPMARRPLVALLAILAGGVLFWFLAAPLWRYGMCFVVPLLSVMAGFLSPWPLSLPWGRGMARSRMLPLLPLIPLFVGEVAGAFGVGRQWPVARQSQVVHHESRHGAIVRQPQGDDRCWAAEWPCSPVVDPHLRFTMIGPWRAALHDPD